MLDLISRLETRRSEFVSRLTVAWSTSPQVRNLGKVSGSLAERLRLLIDLTIPVMKLTIGQWAMQMNAKNAGDAMEAVTDATNDMLQEYAKESAQAISDLALLSQTPSIKPETLLVIAESIETQNDGIVKAAAEGQRLRAELDDTAIKVVRRIDASDKKRQQSLIELVTTAKRPLELEPSPEIPVEVLAYEGQKAA